MKKTLILYPTNTDGSIKTEYMAESVMMAKFGFIINDSSIEDLDATIIRGYMYHNREDYPFSSNSLNNWDANQHTLLMSKYMPVIKEWSMPTFFTDTLLNSSLQDIIKKMGWEKAFVRSDSKSLFFYDYKASTWPDTPFDEMDVLYKQFCFSGPFAIRQFIDNPEIFFNEQRYWVLNGVAHHPSGIIPDFVQEAATRLYKFSGSHYFTIDVAGDYIVEVNPGESSDRGGDNPLEWFCKIFAENFLY